MIVGLDGNSDFTNIQAAVDAVPKDNNKRVKIHIKKGVYKESFILISLL